MHAQERLNGIRMGELLYSKEEKTFKSIANGQHQSRCEDYNSRLALKHGHEDTRARMVPPTRHVDPDKTASTPTIADAPPSSA